MMDAPAEPAIDLQLTVNGTVRQVRTEARTSLCDLLRDALHLTGTHAGCEHGVCGACTVLLDGQPVRSCSFPSSAAQGRRITTIEGLSEDSSHPVQRAWKELDVPQCGYCQSGQILAAVALLDRKPVPTDADIDEAMTNICRCGTYVRIRKAIHVASNGGGK